MAIRTVVTRGYGNGTFNGTIGLVVTRGYAISDVVVPTSEGIEYTLGDNRLGYTINGNPIHYTLDNENV